MHGSQPSWAAWIEILMLLISAATISGRSPLGLRGLKSLLIAKSGETGYKSQPSWAAWIEILCTFADWGGKRSQPSWAAWIEIILNVPLEKRLKSQPSWAAWIEIVW